MLSNIETSYRPAFYPEKKTVRGKKVLILGDSAGIGRASAMLLAEQGAHVFFVAQSPAELNDTFAEMAQEGGQWDGTVVDFHQESGPQQLFEQTSRRLGKIDIFIHPFSMGECENCEGLVQIALQHMNRGGQIIQLRQEDTISQSPRLPDKGQLITLRRDARAQGIHLTRIEPAAGDYRDLSLNRSALDAGQVASYILDNLTQPFSVDVLFLPGMFQQAVM